MKRITGLLVFAVLLATPFLAIAAESKGGVGLYVAPRFIYGSTGMKSLEIEGNNFNDVSGMKKSGVAYGGALAVGYDLGRQTRVPLRLEVEGAIYSQIKGEEPWEGSKYIWTYGNDIVNFGYKQKLNIKTAFVNLYYDFRNETPFSFWIGGGAGMAYIDSKASYSVYFPPGNSIFGGSPYEERWSAGKKKNSNFAWNVGAGVGYDISNAVTLDIGYRFSRLGGVKSNECVGLLTVPQTHQMKTGSVNMHQLLLGLRLTF